MSQPDPNAIADWTQMAADVATRGLKALEDGSPTAAALDFESAASWARRAADAKADDA